jgi:hypothetical protein
MAWPCVTTRPRPRWRRRPPSIPLFRQVFTAEPGWMELTGRLHVPGIVPDTAEGRALVAGILRGARPETPVR